MTSVEGIDILAQATLATSAAAALVLCLRKGLMAKFGASVAYAAWGLIPVAWVAVLLPAPEMPAAVDFIGSIGLMTTVSASVQETATPGDWKPLLLAIWAFGSLAMLAWLGLQQRRFDRQLVDSELREDGLRVARITAGLPAVVGVLRPRIVLPADFDTRYDAAEQEMILCHERIHIARRDLHANAIAAVLRSLQWFNPLLHYAFVRFRRDQELACDERVVARHPQQRRSYANAMLKTHMADSPLPVGCHWQGSHPLKERIEMLKEHARNQKHPFAGVALVSLLFITGGFAAWAAQPAQQETRSSAAEKPVKEVRFGPEKEHAATELVAIKREPLQYPPEAARQGITGTVDVLVDVDAAGNVTGAQAVKVEPATAAVLVDASVEGVKQWKFRPVTENGRQVAARGNVKIEWTILH